MDERAAFTILKKYRYDLTRQQVRTLHGQIKAGYTDDAIRGMARLLMQKKG